MKLCRLDLQLHVLLLGYLVSNVLPLAISPLCGAEGRYLLLQCL